MTLHLIRCKAILLFCCISIQVHAQQLFEMPADTRSRLSSFENPNGVPANGGKTNRTAKGNAFEMLEAGSTKSLLNITGSGTIQRIWLTIDHSRMKLRSIRLQCFWDGATSPAVDVPLGDFFVYNLGRQVAFESALFTTGEGRSYNCYIPMPFRKGARIQLVNEGTEAAKLFFDVDYILAPVTPKSLYFHAYWNRSKGGELGKDLELLPRINGKGRFLGLSMGLVTDPVYQKSWWGEGEVKMYLDSDKQYPTINGTGAEDYLGSAWGLGRFTHQYQGCTIADDSLGEFNFYRWHVPDAVYFNTSLRVTMQQIGGWDKAGVLRLQAAGARIKPVTVDAPGKFLRLLDMEPTPALSDSSLPDGWVNFFRVDDYAWVSYFYLDRPVHDLPPLPPVAERTAGLAK